jgi:hypothetical protein
VLRIKLRYLDQWNTARQAHAHTYIQQLQGLVEAVPVVQPRATHVYCYFVIQVQERDRFRQILSQEGKLLDTWYQFSRPSAIFIDAHDTIYVGDSESGSVAKTRTDWKRGLRIGSLQDGTVAYFIPDPTENATNTSSAEGVAVDRHGVIYGAEVGQRDLKRYVKRP